MLGENEEKNPGIQGLGIRHQSASPSIDFSPSSACLPELQGREEAPAEAMEVDLPCEAADVSDKDGMLFCWFNCPEADG